ncbi:solute carrier family 35 member G1-like [Tachypleus tridentatus]|uniref:solute carrier family 35 member G1-like n=1 Tax=Tachypleus tridentatus TaxID=6853 RepID=UPI003FD68F14
MGCGQQYHGILLILLSGFLDAFIGVLVQSIENRSFMNIMGLSQVVRIFLLLPLIILKDVKLNHKRKTILLTSIRCLTGALGDTLLYYSYTLLTLGEATAIYSTNPVFANIFALLIFKSSFRWSNFVSCFLCFVGVFIISQPHFLFAADEQFTFSYKGISVGLASSLLDALSYNINNMLGVVNYLLLTMYLTINMILLWIFYLISDRHLLVIGFADCSWTNFYISIIGLAGLLTVLSTTRGYQLVEAGPGSIASCTVIVFGYIFQLFIQNSPVRVMSIVGALFITIAVLISSLNIINEKNNTFKRMTEDIN